MGEYGGFLVNGGGQARHPGQARHLGEELSNGKSSAADRGSTSEDKGADIAANGKPKEISTETLVSKRAEEDEEEKEVEEVEGWLSKVSPGVRLRLKEQLTVVL